MEAFDLGRHCMVANVSLLDIPTHLATSSFCILFLACVRLASTGRVVHSIDLEAVLCPHVEAIFISGLGQFPSSRADFFQRARCDPATVCVC